VKRIRCIVLAAVLAGPGCLELPALHKEQAPPPPTAAAAPPPPAPPIVTPEGVTEANAKEKAKALQAEIEHDLTAASTADGE
jgi:hypothetical protein